MNVVAGISSDTSRNGRHEMDTTLECNWLTAEEAAAYLKVKVRSLLLWVRQGKVPAYALSGTARRIWRFRREDLDAHLLANVVSSLQSSSVR